jgi:hypothetical protein
MKLIVVQGMPCLYIENRAVRSMGRWVESSINNQYFSYSAPKVVALALQENEFMGRDLPPSAELTFKTMNRKSGKIR